MLGTTLLLPLLALSCIPEYGTNGPALPDPSSGSGPCFEVDLMDGLQGGEEILVLFQCLNERGAFTPLQDLVTWLCTSEAVVDVVDLANGLMGTFDVVGGLETAARLVEGDDPPAGDLLDLYAEAYELGVLPSLVGVAWEAMDEMAACEAGYFPERCSLPTWGARILRSDLVDTALYVVDEVKTALPAPDRVAQVNALVRLLHDSSTAAGNPTNPLLELASWFITEPLYQDSPLTRLLPHLQYLLNGDMDGDGEADHNPDDDDFLVSLAPHLARLYREGTLQELPDQLKYLQTYDSNGDYVGFEGVSILDELLEVTQRMGGDTSMLEQEFTVPGSTEPTTLLDLALQVADDLYVEGADVEEIVEQLDWIVNDQVCGGSASSELCSILAGVMPPLTAAVETGITDALLPIVYVAHHSADMGRILDLLDLALEMDLVNRIDFLGPLMADSDGLSTVVDLVPVFIRTDLGTFTQAGEDGIALLRWAINPWVWEEDGETLTITPLDLPLPLLRRLLDPQSPWSDLDVLIGTVTTAMLDENSPFYTERLLGSLDQILAALPDADVDVLELAQDLLNEQELWISALSIGADTTFMELLLTSPDRQGATWYLYDLIERGTLDDVLTWTAGLLDLLTAEGLLQPWGWPWFLKNAEQTPFTSHP